jgi:hypothetical protein
MPNAHLTTTHAKHRALANSVGPQVVAHKSTGGIVNSFPEPVDPVGNASHRLTNHTVALPQQSPLRCRHWPFVKHAVLHWDAPVREFLAVPS